MTPIPRGAPPLSLEEIAKEIYQLFNEYALQ